MPVNTRHSALTAAVANTRPKAVPSTSFSGCSRPPPPSGGTRSFFPLCLCASCLKASSARPSRRRTPPPSRRRGPPHRSRRHWPDVRPGEDAELVHEAARPRRGHRRGRRLRRRGRRSRWRRSRSTTPGRRVGDHQEQGVRLVGVRGRRAPRSRGRRSRPARRRSASVRRPTRRGCTYMSTNTSPLIGAGRQGQVIWSSRRRDDDVAPVHIFWRASMRANRLVDPSAPGPRRPGRPGARRAVPLEHLESAARGAPLRPRLRRDAR